MTQTETQVPKRPPVADLGWSAISLLVAALRLGLKAGRIGAISGALRGGPRSEGEHG